MAGAPGSGGTQPKHRKCREGATVAPSQGQQPGGIKRSSLSRIAHTYRELLSLCFLLNRPCFAGHDRICVYQEGGGYLLPSCYSLGTILRN